MKALILNFCKKSNARLTENEKLPQTRILPKTKFFGWPKDGFERCNEKPKTKHESKTKSNWSSIHWIKQNRALTACWQKQDQTFDSVYSSRIVEDAEDEKEPYARWRSLFAPVFCLHLNRRGEDDRSSLGHQGCRQNSSIAWCPNFSNPNPFYILSG